MVTDDLRIERHGPTVLLTLDRPAARNAYSDAMVTALVDALGEAERDTEVRAIVLTGAGDAFHAGGDLKLMRAADGMFAGGPAELRSRYVAGIQTIPRKLAACDKPIIAAINGAAIGAGLDLACMCDLRVAAAGAKLGSTFVKVGLVPGDGGAYFLARTVGFPRALELMLTGRLVDAAEALTLGLVHRVVPGEELMKEAMALAEELGQLPPVALRLTKRAAYRAWDSGMEAALELASTYQGIAQSTEDHKAAVAAILERQPARYRGR